MRVIFLPEVRLYLRELVYVLYYNNYFGTEESATNYVRELWADITTDPASMPAKPAPPTFNRFGTNLQYASFRRNRQTCWYVFFNEYKIESEIVYQVRHITNNHVIAQYL